MQQYEVSGTFRCGDEWRPYTKTVSAPNEAQADGTDHDGDRFQAPAEENVYYG